MVIEQVKVRTKAELITALDKKIDEIIVEGDFTQIVAEIKKGQLNDTESIGFAIGSGGSGVLFEYGISKLMEVFDLASKEDKKLRRQIERLYTIKYLKPDAFLLRLKQLDY
ncbi:hypothetical protein [Enterococcus wangshanyuanii]|uniref:Uncharacterized protein n=1 Tax=Enterococcus wangshanyuanii TaxID=2005703 RepID=A0ABQ1PE12_9ENTE|nr:hypothetical protein [Enterococcus wangshanyuanii]GGC95304.1 hypothetical protein GCM10011573_26230 [Enterococcus wangshanyuanii]